MMHSLGKLVFMLEGVLTGRMNPSACIVVTFPFFRVVTGCICHTSSISRSHLECQWRHLLIRTLLSSSTLALHSGHNAQAQALATPSREPRSLSHPVDLSRGLKWNEIQDVVRRYKETHNGFDNFQDKVSFQMNDTHPIIAVPELMRVLMDENGLGWTRSWEIITKVLKFASSLCRLVTMAASRLFV